MKETGLITKSQVEQMTAAERNHFLKYDPQCYNYTREEDFLMDKCNEIITKAYTYKGLNIDKEKIKTTAMLFYEDLKKKFQYVSIWLIADTLHNEGYGENYNVSVKELTNILKDHLFEINRKNKERQIELKKLRNTPQIEDKRTDEEKMISYIQNKYEDFLEHDYLFDYRNEIFQFLLENEIYEWTDKEIKQAELIARNKTRKIAESKLADAQKHLDMGDIKTISNILKTDIRKYETFGFINKTELVKIYFQKMKEQKIEKLELKILEEV